MPTIPVLQGATVKPAGINPDYASSAVPDNAFGTDIAQAGTRAAAAVAHYGNVTAEIADTTRVNYETTNFDNSLNQMQDAAQQKKGGQAIGVADATMSQALGLAQDVSKGMANDYQRRQFQARAQQMLASRRAALLRYETAESEKFGIDTSIAGIATSAESAAKNWTQPEVVATSVKNAKIAVTSDPRFMGWSDDRKALALADAESSVYANVLRAQDSSGAHAAFIKTFEAVEGKLNAADAATFGAIYKGTTDLVENQAVTAAIIVKYPNDENAALNEARATLTGKQEEAAVQAIKVRYAEQNAARVDYQRRVIDTSWAAFEAGGQRWKAIPVATQMELRAFGGEIEQRMHDIEEQNANGRSSSPKHSDLKAWGAWIVQDNAWKMDPKNHPLTVLGGKVTDEDMKYALRNLEDIHNFERGLTAAGGPRARPPLDVETTQGMVDTAVRENAAYFYASDSKNDSDELIGAFEKYVRNGVDAYQKKNGVRPDRISSQEIIDAALIEGTRPGKYWGTNPVRRFQGAEGAVFPEVTPPAPTIPPSEREAIIQRITARWGADKATDENIQKQYEFDHAAGP